MFIDAQRFLHLENKENTNIGPARLNWQHLEHTK